MATENDRAQFRAGLMRVSYRQTFLDKHDGKPVQYAGLYAGPRLLSTGDMREEDAKILCDLCNESVLRRVAERRQK